MRLIDAKTLKNRILEIYPMDIGGEAVQKAVIRTVDDAPTIGGWISVKDRLPEDERHVLVWVKDGYSLIDWTFNGRWQVNPHMRNDITHWMPLPEPPLEGESNG